MLVRLSIRDIVLIERLDLEFSRGLTTLTGETGAGKSILLDALLLALGARGDGALVRAGEAQGHVSAVFDLPGAHPARAVARDFGLDARDELILRRVQLNDGRTRGFVNDQPASAQALRAIAREIIEFHCQHDERALVDPSSHRARVDVYGGLSEAVEETRARHTAWQEARALEAEEEARRAKALAEAEYLRHASAELEALAPRAGEEDSLAARRQTMLRAEKIAADLREAFAAFSGGASPAAELAATARRLERRLAQAPELLELPARAMATAIDALGAAEQALADALQAAAYDPAELERVEERLFALRAAARKHQLRVDELPALAVRFSAELAALDAGEARLATLKAQTVEAKASYEKAAAALSAARRAAASKLDARVAAELKPLKLDGARFATEIWSDPERCGPDGYDRVEFWVETNPGSRPGPLTKIASGGELARFMLALKVALAESGSAPTLIFDEIDTGVGGAVADAIGQRLAKLAARAQVLAVTHAPQVAARAERHLRIAKSAGGRSDKRATTRVAALSEGERREEIARMLAGARITDEARAAAAKLLEGAGR